MGYAHYVLADGREAGYGVEATCDEDGCTEKIDRGMGYLCGDEPGEDEFGCGKYFCGRHLYGGPRASRGGQCKRCLDEWEADQPRSIDAYADDPRVLPQADGSYRLCDGADEFVLTRGQDGRWRVQTGYGASEPLLLNDDTSAAEVVYELIGGPL
jgi:hypothetical protein